MIKPVAIIAFLGIIGGTTIVLTHKPQQKEVVSANETVTPEAPTLSSTPNVELTEEAPIETNTTNSVTPKPKTTTSSKFTLADLVIPYTPEEITAKLDQNTIKDVEQDGRIDNLETIVNNPTPQPTPVPPPAPTPTPTPQPTPQPSPEPSPAPEPTPPPAPVDSTAPVIYSFVWNKAPAEGNFFILDSNEAIDISQIIIQKGYRTGDQNCTSNCYTYENPINASFTVNSQTKSPWNQATGIQYKGSASSALIDFLSNEDKALSPVYYYKVIFYDLAGNTKVFKDRGGSLEHIVNIY
jgi:hypothetical protein